jgi:hypothetical protein
VRCGGSGAGRGGEVAPAELAPKGGGVLPAWQPRLELAWRDAAEVEVRGQARASVIRKGVLAALVVAHPSFDELLQPLSARSLAARQGVFGRRLEAELVEGREPAAIESPGQVRQLGRRFEHVAAGCVEPGAMEGRKDGVGPTLSGSDRPEVVDRVQPWVHKHLDLRVAQGALEASDTPPRERP